MPSPVTHATGYANALELPFLCGTRTVLMDRWDARRAVDSSITSMSRRQSAQRHFSGVDRGSPRSRLASRSLQGVRLRRRRRAARGDPRGQSGSAEQAGFRVYGSSEAPYVAIGRLRMMPMILRRRPTAQSSTTGSCRIVDAQERAVAAGTEGEILVRGPAMFLRYANDADNRGLFTADGYFRTGDLGTLSAARISRSPVEEGPDHPRRRELRREGNRRRPSRSPVGGRSGGRRHAA